MKKINNWHKVWSSRSVCTDITLAELIKTDGFDTPLGNMDANDWLLYVNSLRDRMETTDIESVFEVGCGCGAFLYPFYNTARIGGLDYAETLITVAKNVFQDCKENFSCSEANELDINPKYDLVIANHVFHYFNDLSYAKSVLEKMLKKANQYVILTALPDFSKKLESENFRRGILSEKEYNDKYKGLDLLYFSKDWISEQLDRYDVKFLPHNMPGFAQNTFRFDCIIKIK